MYEILKQFKKTEKLEFEVNWSREEFLVVLNEGDRIPHHVFNPSFGKEKAYP